MVSPGFGSMTSISSVARTGSCSAGTYERFADSASDPTTRCVAVAISASSLFLGELLRHVGNLCIHVLLVGGPALGVPDLEPVVRADDHAGTLAQAGVLAQLLGEADAARGVQGVVEGAAVEVAAQHPAAL